MGDYESSRCLSLYGRCCKAGGDVSCLALQVVRPLLLEEELQGVFSRLGSLYSKNLAEAFSRIEPMVIIPAAWLSHELIIARQCRQAVGCRLV